MSSWMNYAASFLYYKQKVRPFKDSKNHTLEMKIPYHWMF